MSRTSDLGNSLVAAAAALEAAEEIIADPQIASMAALAFTGNGGKVVALNSVATGFEFIDLPAEVDPSSFVQTTGAQTVAGVKTFSNGIIINGQTLDGLTAAGLALIEAVDAAAQRTALGLVIGTNVQAYSAALAIYSGITPSANVQSLLSAADYAAIRTALSLVVGTNVQAYNANLTTFAGIAPSANVQSVLSAADFAAIRTLLGLVIGTNVQAYSANLTTFAGIAPAANVQSLLGAANYAAIRTLLSLDKANLSFQIDGGGSAITTGRKGAYRIPFGFTVTGWQIVEASDNSGSIVVDIWKDTYANFPPTVADTVTGSEKPTLSSAVKNEDLSLSSWTTSFAEGDYIIFNVDSAATVQQVIITLIGTRT